MDYFLSLDSCWPKLNENFRKDSSGKGRGLISIFKCIWAGKKWHGDFQKKKINGRQQPTVHLSGFDLIPGRNVSHWWCSLLTELFQLLENGFLLQHLVVQAVSLNKISTLPQREWKKETSLYFWYFGSSCLVWLHWKHNLHWVDFYIKLKSNRNTSDLSLHCHHFH